jgi:hypothetical protein
MPDLHQGGEIDVNTDDGFNAALAAAVGGAEETPAEPVAPVAEESAPTQPRNELGQFTELAAQPEVAPEGAASPEPVEEATTPDPLAEYLGRFGDDPRAALEAALREKDEAQSLIGRQGNELGELRKLSEQVARLEGKAEAQPQARPEVPGSNTADIEALEEMVANSGPQATMGWVVENRPDLIEATISAWASEDPVAAARFAARYEANLAFGESQQAQPNQSDEFVESLRRERQLGEGIAHLKSSRSDWEAIKNHIGPTFQDANTPDIIKQAVVDLDPAKQLQGLTALAEIARARALAEATGAAVAERTAQVQAAKTAAQVATGSLRPAPEHKPADDARSDAVKAFQERMMAPETTSVLSGLTSEQA